MDVTINPHTQKYIDSNAEVEHTLLSPFRWVFSLIKWSALVVALLGYWIWNQAGWIANVGEYSQRDRQEKVAQIEDSIGHAQAGNTANSFGYGTFRLDLRSDDVVQGHTGTVADNPHVLPSSPMAFAAARGTWSGRSDRSFERKAARIYAAYANSTFMASALQVALTRLSPAGQHITIANAPVVQLQQVNLLFLPATTVDADHEIVAARPLYFSGICLVAECAEADLMYGTTTYADLFSEVVPLTVHQEHAVAALNAMSTDEFWLRTAHLNGIQGQDAAVKAAADAARHARDTALWPQGQPEGLNIR